MLELGEKREGVWIRDHGVPRELWVITQTDDCEEERWKSLKMQDSHVGVFKGK